MKVELVRKRAMSAALDSHEETHHASRSVRTPHAWTAFGCACGGVEQDASRLGALSAWQHLPGTGDGAGREQHRWTRALLGMPPLLSLCCDFCCAKQHSH